MKVDVPGGGTMQLRYHEISTLPPLAWCARADRRSDTVAVFHGSRVETRPDVFVEGAWNGPYAAMKFTEATTVAGTGGVAEPGRIRFSTSTDHLGLLFSVAKGGSLYVSNSPAFALTLSGEEPDPAYPFYSYDLLESYRLGMYGFNYRLRLRRFKTMGVHASTLINVDARGRMTFEPHRLCAAPTDFESYRSLLIQETREVAANAADPARKFRYAPIVSLSKGYDSTAAAVLAKEAGCTQAYTYTDNRHADPKRDSGASNARFFLKMSCAVYQRWQYVSLERNVEAEFGYTAINSKAPSAVAETQLTGSLLFLGESGDYIWTPESADVYVALAKPWIRISQGLSPIEFRLRVGYLVFAPPVIAARHNRVINAIAIGPAMRPWTIGGDYDRPLPRRIIEEAGIPRDRFATIKAASSQSHLNDPRRFSPQGLADYRQFVEKRNAAVSARVMRYWQMRLKLRHAIWDRKTVDERRYVPSSALQRRFPFVLNAAPIRVPWEYAFTFQWTVAAMRDRYVFADAMDGQPVPKAAFATMA